MADGTLGGGSVGSAWAGPGSSAGRARAAARAPQAILVAVAPDAAVPWSLETLESILLETLDLASLRLVDPDATLELDHYLPALSFALNATDDVNSTDLRQPRPATPGPSS